MAVLADIRWQPLVVNGEVSSGRWKCEMTFDDERQIAIDSAAPTLTKAQERFSGMLGMSRREVLTQLTERGL